MPRILFFILVVSSLYYCCTNSINTNAKSINAKPFIDTNLLANKILEAKKFTSNKKYNNNIFILLDLKAHSGLERLFVVEKNKIVKKACVSHGCGTNEWGKDFGKESVQISNTADSHCSSIGKYKIGARGKSAWGIGINYLMIGLEASNSNALKRQIVLHSWDAITDSAVYPNGSAEGWGCPAVSNNTMLFLDSLLKESKKPILLWVY